MTDDKTKVYNMIGSAQIDYKVHGLSNLHFNLNASMDYTKGDGIKYISEYSPSDAMYGGSDSNWKQQKRNTLLEFYPQYFHKLDLLDSKFDVMGGYSWQHYWKSGDNFGQRITRFDENGDPQLAGVSDYETENYIISFFGRFNYSVKDKYLLTFTLRNDGSSRFSKENRWALFPSTALAWRMIDEDFFKNVKAVSNMKLRLGWGITGQQEINLGDYPYLATYEHSLGSEASYIRGYNADGTPRWSSLLRPSAYNRDLKWESTTTYNAGIDYGFLKNRIDGSLDVYHRKTKDLINVQTKIPAGTNFKEFVVANIGSMENTGVELAIDGRPVMTKNLTWEIGANVAYNKNEITKLSHGDANSPIRFDKMKVHQVGQPAGMFYVYEQIYDEKGKPIEGFYRDRNNDGKINEEDLYLYHNSVPDVTFGLNSKWTWKAWDLAVAGHGSIGNYNYNQLDAQSAGLSPTSVYANEFLVNRMQSAFDTNFQTGQNLSDYYIQNASFFRIDNIVLGWSFRHTKKLPFNGRVYGTVQNPFVFTKYKGLDPEVFGGMDGNVYPRPLTVMLGVNLNF